MSVMKSRTRLKTTSKGDPQLVPCVSVITPVYNRAGRIRKSIDSALAQTYENFELVIVDDGSTDDLARVLSDIKDPRLRIVAHDENKGAAAARNTGISQARGTYVAFLDSDDCWLPEKLERQLGFMRDHVGEFRLSCTAYMLISPYYKEGETRFLQPVTRNRDLQTGCRLSPGATLMAERTLFSEVGPMREDLPRLEDWDWLLRCSKLSDIGGLGEPLSVVDSSRPDQIDYESVRTSVNVLKRAHVVPSIFWRSKGQRLFLATLENELAASAYRSGKYGKAVWHLIRSLGYSPFREVDSFRRITRAVFSDAFRSRFKRSSIRPGDTVSPLKPEKSSVSAVRID